ncbi:hypothetical protein AC578_7381 [Pseudocercospora eumusae]|uniref:Uncharacterized protein n=1 Tax=Pseudocercospora eumusae TaxID=321146 RepID=A0A139H4Q5_9PEZI|nr:hypothetical protein AC578_7381 [Pseudocercospora eumusae]
MLGTTINSSTYHAKTSWTKRPWQQIKLQATAKVVDAPSQAYRRELALLEAAEYGHLQRFKRFLDAGDVHLDFVDSKGRAALYFAAHEGHLEIVNALINSQL